MTLPKRKFRELLLQVLFAKDFYSDRQDSSFLMDSLKTTKKQAVLAEKEADRILKEKVFLDGLIRKVSTEYRLERISKVELNVLRLILFEIFFTEISRQVAIAEAIRLCRKFGSEQSFAFVQALLDRILKENPSRPER